MAEVTVNELYKNSVVSGDQVGTAGLNRRHVQIFGEVVSATAGDVLSLGTGKTYCQEVRGIVKVEAYTGGEAESGSAATWAASNGSAVITLAGTAGTYTINILAYEE